MSKKQKNLMTQSHPEWSQIQHPFRLLLLGPTNSGKSSFNRALVNNFNFDLIYLISSNTDNPNYDYADFCYSVDHKGADRIIEQAVSTQKEYNYKFKTLFVIEDLTGLYSPSTTQERVLRRFLTEARNYNMSVLMAVHRFTAVRPIIRENISHLVLTAPVDFDHILKEIVSGIDRPVLKDLYSKIIIRSTVLILTYGGIDSTLLKIHPSYATVDLF